MAILTKTTNENPFDNILPAYGNARVRIPVWDNGQRMFICDEHDSSSGHRYYRGVRFCDRIVIVEKVGLFHNWTYIDGIELYAFNGHRLELIQKRDYDKVFRSEEFIRRESCQMVADFLSGVMKMQRSCVSAEQIEAHARELIDRCYKSFLDPDYNTRLIQILPSIER